MKKSELKILLVELLLIISLAFNIFVLNIFTDMTLAVFILLNFLVLVYFLGLEKDNFAASKDIIMTIIIYVISYYIFIYVFGIFQGFLINGYSLKFINIIKNILPIIVLQVCKELLRYEINIKGEFNKLIIILSVLLFIMIDISGVLFLYDFSIKNDILSLIEVNLIPVIAENILMTYVSLKAGYKANIIYQLLMKLPFYILPIIPDINVYLDIIFRLILPCLILHAISKSLRKKKRLMSNEEAKIKKINKISYVITAVFILVVVYLTSGIFTYYALTIGSESMTPNINKGDLVIVKKIKNYEDLEIGDVIVYKKEQKVVVHRLTDIVPYQNGFVYKTKGDANENEDGYIIYQSEVLGTVKFKIRYIGYPTVWLNELIN